jgi:hypothetical protein
MLGQQTAAGPVPAHERTEALIDRLVAMGEGNDAPAFMAKRLAVGVANHTLPCDVVERMADMPDPAIDRLINRLEKREATLYDLSRQIVFCLAGRRLPIGPGRRRLQLG